MHSCCPFEVTIEKLVYGGSGLGRSSGKVVFVPYSAPGDRLLVQTLREKKNYTLGTIAEILSPAPGRINPPCPHFGKCGGCHLQHMTYPLQVEAKENILREVLHHRFPYTRDISITMEECPQPLAYRSRARIQVRKSAGTISTGFYRSESHTVEAIKECILLRPPLNQALEALRSSEPDTGIGMDIRELDIAGSYEEGLWTVFSADKDAGTGALGSEIQPRAWNHEVLLKRKVGKFVYSVTAASFFQANDFMIARLVELVREMAEDCSHNTVLDLFAGVGLFSLPLAELYGSVVAVEHSRTASELSSANASAAGMDGIQSVCADVADWLQSHISKTAGSFDLILLDPPRSGAGSRIMEQIRSLAPKTILYISCDPQTLARDLSCITEDRYVIEQVVGLDMFPQTFHFETIVRLIRS